MFEENEPVLDIIFRDQIAKNEDLYAFSIGCGRRYKGPHYKCRAQALMLISGRVVGLPKGKI